MKLTYQSTSSLLAFCLALFLLLLPSHAVDTTLPSQPTPEEKAFITAVSQALAKSDIDALLGLDYTGGVPEIKSIQRSFYQDLVARGCLALKLERADPATATRRKEGKDLVTENLPVQWILTIQHPGLFPGARVTTILRAGILAGKIRITNSKVVKSGTE